MGIYEVNVEHEFSATHAVKLADGTSEPRHAHDWRVMATFRAASLDSSGMVVDFVAVQKALRTATADLEGCDLDRRQELSQCGATAEALAAFLAERLADGLSARLYKVTVTEAPGCTAAYYPQGP